MAEIFSILQFCFAVSGVRGKGGLLSDDEANAFSNVY